MKKVFFGTKLSVTFVSPLNLPVKQCPVLTVPASNITGQEGNYSDTVYGRCNLGYHTDAGYLEDFNLYCNESGEWSTSYACESE